MNTLMDSGMPAATPPAAPTAPVAPQAAQLADPKAQEELKKVAKRLKAAAEEARTDRDKLVEGEWKQNVEYRKNRPFKKESEDHRVTVPVDWSFTKSKEAGLFSQVPTAILTPKQDKYKPVVITVQKELNDVLTTQVKAGVMMEEVLADVINAAGVAGVYCSYIATFEDRQAPNRDLSMVPPEQHQQLFDSGAVQMVTAPFRVDCKFSGTRLSPSQLLWPKAFKGSDFDEADWVGYDGTCTWAQAMREFQKTAERPNGLTADMKEKACGVERSKSLSDQADEAMASDGNEIVTFTRLFYWAARQDPLETKLEKIRTIVYVNGIDEPVIEEDLKWQEWSDETESFVGLTKFPLRFLTLTYISDMPVPPSDSEIGRPSVDEEMHSRTQMMLQRDRSMPLRWANVNRIDPMIMANLMKGDIQQIIPTNGDGTTAIGETARANYPAENWDFDRVIKQDLMDAWQVGPNQTGGFNPAGRTAAEANIVQDGFATRQAKERAKVGAFFCGVAETILGLMQMFYDGPKEAALIGPDAQQAMNTAWDRKKVSAAKFVCSIREDSTVKLNASQRLDQLTKFLNIAGKSGFVNVQEILAEMAQLSNLDPSKIIVAPNPKEPDPPNISLRAGGEDLRDPIVGPYLIALMQKGHPVQPADVEAAKQLLIASSSLPTGGAAPGAPGMPPQPGVVSQPPSGPVPPPGTPPPPGHAGPPVQQPPHNYGPMERVTKRVNEIGG